MTWYRRKKQYGVHLPQKSRELKQVVEDKARPTPTLPARENFNMAQISVEITNH